jgi:serine/threonine protein kinase
MAHSDRGHDRTSRLSTAFGPNVCKMLGTMPGELANVINPAKYYDNIVNPKLFGTFKAKNISILNIRENGNVIYKINPPSGSPLAGRYYVLKLIFGSPDSEHYERSVISEHMISKASLSLVEHNITPHVLGSIFLLYGKNKEDDFSEIRLNELKAAYAKRYIKNYADNKAAITDADAIYTNLTVVSFVIQESFELAIDYHMNDLHGFLYESHNYEIDVDFAKILYILFQVIYTLKIFSKVGIIHQDIKFDNILVNIRKRLNLSSREYTAYKFIDDHKKNFVLLQNIGIDSAIIDFGMAVKNISPETNSVVMKHALTKGEYCYEFGKEGQYITDNFKGTKIEPFLSIGEGNEDVDLYEDLFMFIKAFIDYLKYKKYPVASMSEYEKIFFKGKGNLEIFYKLFDSSNVDSSNVDSSNVDSSNVVMMRELKSKYLLKSEYPKAQRLVNSFDEILTNIITKIRGISSELSPQQLAAGSKITKTYSIKNIYGEKRSISPTASNSGVESESFNQSPSQSPLQKIIEPTNPFANEFASSKKRNPFANPFASGKKVNSFPKNPFAGGSLTKKLYKLSKKSKSMKKKHNRKNKTKKY